jgi:hypothetical protein
MNYENDFLIPNSYFLIYYFVAGAFAAFFWALARTFITSLPLYLPQLAQATCGILGIPHSLHKPKFTAFRA